MGEQEFDFKIPKKDFRRILLWRRKWYLLAMAVLLILLVTDGVALGLTASDGVKGWLIAPIPVLALAYGRLWFLGFTDGGPQIYGDCHAAFYEDGTLTISCNRESFYSLQDKMGFKKTIKITKAIEKGDYWIFYGEHRQWTAIPAESPIPSRFLARAK